MYFLTQTASVPVQSQFYYSSFSQHIDTRPGIQEPVGEKERPAYRANTIESMIQTSLGREYREVSNCE